MPIRPHYQRTLRDGTGAARPGATITLFKAGTDDPPEQIIYTDAAGLTERGQTWVSGTGVVDFYTDEADIYDISVMFPGDTEPQVFRDQWIGDAENVTGEGGGIKSTAVDEIIEMTSTQYTALSPKASRTLYVVRSVVE